ncbi:AraC family transcriptional regulator [Photobacterium nomapromontoriensis]|uniref:AraC family transcriptional regulator n=1 Tax=Photobacterium nomapromontoriensis TaxID=2910237 RepID=UPI003D0BE0B4
MQSCAEKGASLCLHYGLGDKTGIVDTELPGVRLFRITQYHRMTPQMYQQGVVVILQGNKVGHLNEYRFEYDTKNCLIVATPYPIACETFASEDAPLIGIDIEFDLTIIQELVDMVEQFAKGGMAWSTEPNRGVAVTKITPDLQDSICRLLSCLNQPLDAKVLGRQLLRELYFQLLKTEQGYLLSQYCKQDSSLARVAKVINHVQANFDQKLSINELAEMAGMSVSVFHRTFKQVVTDPPLQYIKKIRLNKAKTMMSQDGMAANVAAIQVGYESPTQFSREFKRYFGLPPSKASQIGIS